MSARFELHGVRQPNFLKVTRSLSNEGGVILISQIACVKYE